MIIVPDASAMVAALVDTGPTGAWALDLISTRHLAAPHLLVVECASVLRRAAMAGDISDDTAALAHRDLIDVSVEFSSYEPLATRIWELRSNLTPYDSWYVALAEHLAAPLVTLDQRIGRAPGIRCEVVTAP